MRNKKLFFLAIPILLILTAFSVPNRAADTDESGNEDGALSTSSDDTYYILNSSTYEPYLVQYDYKEFMNNVFSNNFVINKAPDKLYNMSCDFEISDYKNNFTFQGEENNSYTDHDPTVDSIDFVDDTDTYYNSEVAILDKKHGRNDVMALYTAWVENVVGSYWTMKYNVNFSMKMWMENESTTDLTIIELNKGDEGPEIDIDFNAIDNTITYCNGTPEHDIVFYNGTESISEQWLDVKVEYTGSESGSGALKTTVISENGTYLVDRNETTDWMFYEFFALNIENDQSDYPTYFDNIYIEPNKIDFYLKDYENSTSTKIYYVNVTEAYFNETDENLTCGYGFEHQFYPDYNYVNSSAENIDIAFTYALYIPYYDFDNVTAEVQIYYYEEVTIEEEECPDCPEEEDEECPSCPTCPEVPEWYEILNWEYFSLLLVFIPVLLLCGIAYIIIREATV